MSENENHQNPNPHEDASNGICEFAKYIVKNLVDNPDAVRIDPTYSERIIILELRVDKKDMGKVIGREGNTIRAIRQLVSAVSAKFRLKVTLDIPEDDKS